MKLLKFHAKLRILASVTNSAVVNPNDIKTLFINGNPAFNVPIGLPRNAPDSTTFDSWVFDNFTLADELFARALQALKLACLLVKVYAEIIYQSHH